MNHNTPTGWTTSKAEEVISALWFIAAFCAMSAGWMFIGWCMFVKACFDFLCAIYYAGKELY